MRVSFGAYSTRADVEAAVEMIARIRRGDYQGHYRQSPVTGDLTPIGYEDDFGPHFSVCGSEEIVA